MPCKGYREDGRIELDAYAMCYIYSELILPLGDQPRSGRPMIDVA